MRKEEKKVEATEEIGKVDNDKTPLIEVDKKEKEKKGDEKSKRPGIERDKGALYDETG